MTQQTLTRLRNLKLTGMADAVQHNNLNKRVPTKGYPSSSG